MTGPNTSISSYPVGSGAFQYIQTAFSRIVDGAYKHFLWKRACFVAGFAESEKQHLSREEPLLQVVLTLVFVILTLGKRHRINHTEKRRNHKREMPIH